MQRSILGPLLPDAMVYYLENHGADKFAQIFLGEFDTPEAIWNAEMRYCPFKNKNKKEINNSMALKIGTIFHYRKAVCYVWAIFHLNRL